MKIKYEQLYNMRDSLGKLMKLEGLKASTAIRIAKLGKALQSEIGLVLEQRDKLVMKHGQQVDADSFRITPDMPGYPDYAKAFIELLQEEVEVSAEPVELPAEVEVAPMILLAMEPFVSVAGTARD